MKVPNKTSHIIIPVVLAAALLVSGCSSKAPKKTLTKEVEQKRVKVISIEKTSFVEEVELIGETKPVETLSVKAVVAGQIEFIEDTLGKTIKKDEQLVAISRDLYIAQYMASKANNLFNKNNYNRQLDLFKNGFSTSQNIEQSNLQYQSAEAQLRQSKFQLESADVKAPFDGIVSRVYVNTYDVVAPGSPVLEFADISSLDIPVAVTQEHISRFRVGQRVSVYFPAIDRLKIGKVTELNKVADPMSKTFDVVVSVNNPNEAIPAGMIAKVVFPINGYKGVIMVHQNLVQTIKDKTYIPVVIETVSQDGSEDSMVFNEQRLSYKEVETGIVFGEKVMITQGLKEGDLVVIQGANTLENGQLVSIDDGTADK